MLRRETRVGRASLLVAAGFACGGLGLGALVVAGALPLRSVVFVPFAVPVPVPASAPAPATASVPPISPVPGQRKLDEPITMIAAASDAPVIAVATAHRLWVSRDGGESFAAALPGDGEFLTLVVEPKGRVYAVRTDMGDRRLTQELGILDPDGTERWRQPRGGDLLLDARDGQLLAMFPDGFVIGMHAGDAWERVPASRAWIPLRASVGADGVARYLAVHSGGTDHALYLLEVRGGGRARVVWSTPFSDGIGAPSEVTPCAGFAGDRLYLVLRDREPDPRTKWRPGKLITVQRDGRAEARTLPGEVLHDDGLSCEIAGNDRAAYLALGSRRIGHQTLRIDGAEPSAVGDYSMAFDRIAVDAHGRLLHVRNGRLGRLSESGRSAVLLYGSDAR
jgi:hypothetical protein